MRDVAKHLIERMGQIETSDMSISRPPEVVGTNIMGAHIAHIRGANEKAVTIVLLPIVILGSSIITVMMKTELRGIALPDKILPIQIGHHHLPISDLKLVQLAVGIFFQEVEIGDIPLIAIVVEVSKKPEPRFVV